MKAQQQQGLEVVESHIVTVAIIRVIEVLDGGGMGKGHRVRGGGAIQ
jgi:hypothetical protein